MERRNFNQLFALGSLGLAFSSPITNKKISLAQWSLHRAIKINKELSVIINASLNANENTIFTPKSIFKIKYLEWEGLLCYENKNWLNMNELDRKIFMVKGKNGTGKSAIYDILLLAIWGENTKKNSLSSGVVNHNKNKGYTIIDIELNSKETYRIVRNYSKKNIGNKLQVSASVLYKYLNICNETSIEIIKKDSACNNEIQRLFQDHYEEISLLKDYELKPDYARYFSIHEKDMLQVILCKDDEKIVGYIVFFICKPQTATDDEAVDAGRNQRRVSRGSKNHLLAGQ